MLATKDTSAALHGVVIATLGVGGPHAGVGGTPGGTAVGKPGGVPNPLLGGTPVSSDSSLMAGLQALLSAVLQSAAVWWR